MGNPTTRNSTPPQSGRIGQPTKTSAVILSAYGANNFPGIAFTNQLAINLDDNTLAFYDENGAWQGVVGSTGIQSFYEPTAPVTGMRVGDQWYDTSNDNALHYWDGTTWQPLPFGNNATGTEFIGKIFETNTTGLRWVMSGAAGTFKGYSIATLGAYSGESGENAPAGLTIGAYGPMDMDLTIAGAFTNNTLSSAYLRLAATSTGSELQAGGDRMLLGTANTVITVDHPSYAPGVVISPSTYFGARGIQGVDFGVLTSATTSGSGTYVQPHNLGVTPTAVFALPYVAALGVGVRLSARSSSDFTLGFYNTTTGAALTGTNVGFTWIAIA